MGWVEYGAKGMKLTSEWYEETRIGKSPIVGGIQGQGA